MNISILFDTGSLAAEWLTPRQLDFDLFVRWDRANERENNREQDKAVAHTKHYDTEPELEEDDEDVGFRRCQHDDGKEGWETSMNDAGAHFWDGYTWLVHAFLIIGAELYGRLYNQVGMSDVSRVVDWEAKANDEVHYNDIVQGQVPEEDETEQKQIDENDG